MHHGMIAALKGLVLALALLHHGGPSHGLAAAPAHTAGYYAVHPCAAGHPPVNPDAGACIGSHYIPS